MDAQTKPKPVIVAGLDVKNADVLGTDLETLCGALGANTEAAFGSAW